MHSNSTLFTGKRTLENGDNLPRKKIKIDDSVTINIPRSNIYYYKNKICKLVYENINFSPNRILINLLLDKKNEDANIRNGLFSNTHKKQLDFESELLTQLRNRALSIVDIIPHINHSLKNMTLNPNDSMFGLLIAFFYYYLDFYRINFTASLKQFPYFKEQIFIPLEIYKKQKIEKQDKHCSRFIIQEIKNIITLEDWNYSYEKLKFLTILSLSDKQKEELLEELSTIALNTETKKNNPSITKIRSYACLLMRKIGIPKDIDNYLNKIVFPLYYFPQDQFVRSVGCDLLGNVFARVSQTKQADEIFEKIVRSLQRSQFGKLEVEGACQALWNMSLSRKQVDIVFPILMHLSRDFRFYSDVVLAVFRLDLSDEQFKQIQNDKNFISFFFQSTILDFMNIKTRDTIFYENLIDWLLDKFTARHHLEILGEIPIPISRHKRVIDCLNNFNFINEDELIAHSANFRKMIATLKQNEIENIFLKAAKKVLQDKGGVCFSTIDYLPANLLAEVYGTSSFSSGLKEILIANFNYAVQEKKLSYFSSSWNVIEKFSLQIDEINTEAISTIFSDASIAILVLENLGVKLGFKYNIFFDDCFNKLKNFYSISFSTSVCTLIKSKCANSEQVDEFTLNLRDKKLHTPEKQQLLIDLKHLLIYYLILILQNEAGREEVYKIVFFLLNELGPSSIYALSEEIFTKENNSDKRKISTISELAFARKLFAAWKSMIRNQIVENSSFYHFNLLCRFEWENENTPFSFSKHQLMRFMQEETKAFLTLNLVAQEHELPYEVTRDIQRLGSVDPS